MKDETASIPISEYCGLRAKMYSMTYGGKEKKTAKGISRSAAKNLLHQMYKDALFNRRSTKTRVIMIRSIDHQIYSMVQDKIGLSPYDDKKYLLEDGCNTTAHGQHLNSPCLNVL